MGVYLTFTITRLIGERRGNMWTRDRMVWR